MLWPPRWPGCQAPHSSQLYLVRVGKTWNSHTIRTISCSCESYWQRLGVKNGDVKSPLMHSVSLQSASSVDGVKHQCLAPLKLEAYWFVLLSKAQALCDSVVNVGHAAQKRRTQEVDKVRSDRRLESRQLFGGDAIWCLEHQLSHSLGHSLCAKCHFEMTKKNWSQHIIIHTIGVSTNLTCAR